MSRRRYKSWSEESRRGILIAKLGSFEKYNTAQLTAFLPTAETFLKEAEAKRVELRKYALKEELEQQVAQILAAGKLPQKLFSWGPQKQYSDEAQAKAHPLQIKICQLGLPYGHSSRAYELPHLELELEKLAQVVSEIRRAIPIAKVRAIRLENQRIASQARKEASEQRRIAREQAVKALAAAHTGNTRSLAGSVKKELRHQMTLFAHCPYCQGPIGQDPRADHIYPVCKGGLSTHKNMVYVCASCNARKSSLTLLQFINVGKLDSARVYKCLDLLKKDY